MRKHPEGDNPSGWYTYDAGDRLQLLNGEYVIIEQVQHELLEAPVTVYNFEVEDFHTYYVTDSAVLVHNRCHGKEFPDDGVPNSSKLKYGQMVRYILPERMDLIES